MQKVCGAAVAWKRWVALDGMNGSGGAGGRPRDRGRCGAVSIDEYGVVSGGGRRRDEDAADRPPGTLEATQPHAAAGCIFVPMCQQSVGVCRWWV